jgi:imidazoleglycerol phosphate synthase glutamine amidotransferase subunit HisH
MNRVAIIDYGVGNLRSVEKAFAATGCEASISSDESFHVAGSGRIRGVHEGAQGERFRSTRARACE